MTGVGVIAGAAVGAEVLEEAGAALVVGRWEELGNVVKGILR
jgi:hypothetical protein